MFLLWTNNYTKKYYLFAARTMSGRKLYKQISYKLNKLNVGFLNKEIKYNKKKTTRDFDSFIATICLEYCFYYLIRDFFFLLKYIQNFSCNNCSRLLLREKFKLGAWFIFKKRPVCTLFDHMSVINLNQNVINRSLLKFWHRNY